MRTVNTIGSLLLAGAVLIMAPAAALADHHDEVANPDLKCLKCHSKGLKKKLEDGEVMSLKMNVENFETSVHKVIGCTGCHRDVAKGKHPSREPIASVRAYSLKHNKTCSQCHEANHTEYTESIHASLVEEGREDAPLCSDCHSAHAIEERKHYEPVSGEPCSNCHQEIYDAYAESVHGLAQDEGNIIRGKHVSAPICSDCHRAHDIVPAASGDYMVSTCLNCHEGAKVAHEKWLPNAGMHMNSVSCPACHSPEAERVIDLQLYDQVAQLPVGQNEDHAAVKERLSEIDANGDGLDPVELWKLMRRTSQDGRPSDVVLRGRMEVAKGVDAHRLAPRSRAVRSCESCHEGNSESFRNVTVSITKADGRKEKYAAESDVLSSAISLDSVGGFYAPGGTRIKLLDGLVVLALVGGLAMPLGHITLGRIVRGRKETDDENVNDE
jgi:hypothetical protein